MKAKQTGVILEPYMVKTRALPNGTNVRTDRAAYRAKKREKGAKK